MTKGKSQIGINRLIKPHSRGRFICSRCISPLEFTVLLTFSFKTIANSNRQIRRPCVDSVNKFVRLISLINSYFAFSFFSFFYDNVFAIRCICILYSVCKCILMQGPSTRLAFSIWMISTRSPFCCYHFSCIP